jgi:hypothetical protein
LEGVVNVLLGKLGDKLVAENLLDKPSTESNWYGTI